MRAHRPASQARSSNSLAIAKSAVMTSKRTALRAHSFKDFCDSMALSFAPWGPATPVKNRVVA